MTADQAVAIIEREREPLEIDEEMEVTSAEKSIVQVVEDRSGPGPAADRIAWIVTLTGPTGFVRVHVDDKRAEVLEVLRSR